MDRQVVIDRLQASRPQLAQLGARSLYLYGSVARGEAGPFSDVDLLVEGADARFSVFDLIRLRDACSEILEAPVEMHDFGGFQRLANFRREVEGDLIRVF